MPPERGLPAESEPPPENRLKLDPSRPLRMPGASLREPERPLLTGFWELLSSARSRVAAAWPAPKKRAEAAGPGTGTAARTTLGFKMVIGGLVAFALVMIGVAPFQYDSAPPLPTVAETTQAMETVAAPAIADAGVAVAVPGADAAPPPRVFRVRSLAEDASLEIVEGSIGKRPVLTALTSAGLSMKDAYRALRSFKGKTFDRPHAGDAFVYARRRSDRHLVAFEYVVPPFDVWQAREGSDGRLEGSKVAFTPELKRVTRALVVGDDLRKSLAQAELDDELLGMLDDALDGHAELVDMRAGARLRIVALEERIEGTFARYGELEAVEYTPANAKAKAVRVYRFDPLGGRRRGPDRKAHLFFDEHGRQPYKGGFRTPLPLGRITSRFNPRRMHPVLRVVMPHNGVDFAAPIGTPVYSTAAGLVRAAANAGPNGNMVQVQHPNGLVSAYCHLSRFAAGLRPGQHVESRQLVGYVGQTGRSTGPHLHFAIKRGEVFLDPMSLRLDGVRTLPPSDRELFENVRAELDGALDTVALPAAPEGTQPASAEVEDVIYDDVPDAGPADAAAP